MSASSRRYSREYATHLIVIGRSGVRKVQLELTPYRQWTSYSYTAAANNIHCPWILMDIGLVHTPLALCSTLNLQCTMQKEVA